jgi:hypothetical protein
VNELSFFGPSALLHAEIEFRNKTESTRRPNAISNFSKVPLNYECPVTTHCEVRWKMALGDAGALK